jgi:hypothetical protein
VKNALGVPPRHLTDSLPFSSSFELRPASFYTRLMPTPLNNPLNYLYGPSSPHVGGAHHLLGDGAVRFISQDINVLTYDALITRAGGEVVGEFYERKAKVPL